MQLWVDSLSFFLPLPMPSSWTIECSCFDDVSLQFLFLQEGILRSKAPLMLFLRLCCHKPCRLKREKNQSVEWRKSKMNNFLPLTHCNNHTTHSSSAWWCVHLQDFLFSCPGNLYDWKCDSMWRNLYVWVSTLYAYFLILWFYWACR